LLLLVGLVDGRSFGSLLALLSELLVVLTEIGRVDLLVLVLSR
jgi:hypothetical protein